MAIGVDTTEPCSTEFSGPWGGRPGTAYGI